MADSKPMKIEDLTLAEIEIAERRAGLGLDALDDPERPTAGLLGALAWVAKKRGDPTLTYDDFMQATTMEQIDQIIDTGDDEDDPSPARRQPSGGQNRKPKSASASG